MVTTVLTAAKTTVPSMAVMMTVATTTARLTARQMIRLRLRWKVWAFHFTSAYVLALFFPSLDPEILSSGSLASVTFLYDPIFDRLGYVILKELEVAACVTCQDAVPSNTLIPHAQKSHRVRFKNGEEKEKVEQDVADVVARHGLRGLTGYEVPLGPFAVVPFLPIPCGGYQCTICKCCWKSRSSQKSHFQKYHKGVTGEGQHVTPVLVQTMFRFCRHRKFLHVQNGQPPPISDLTPADILLSTVTDLVGLESTAHLPSLDSRAVTFFLDKMGWSTAIDGQEGEKLAELIDMPFEGDQLWPLVGAMREYFHHFSEITLGKLTLLDKRQVAAKDGLVLLTIPLFFFTY